MAESSDKFTVLRRLQLALNSGNFPPYCLKPLQVKCFVYLLHGHDVVAVLPTGFGKSLLFQLIPNFFPVKADMNIVIVVCPLNSIMEDQLEVLKDRGITADVFRLPGDEWTTSESLFDMNKHTSPERTQDETNMDESCEFTMSDGKSIEWRSMFKLYSHIQKPLQKDHTIKSLNKFGSKTYSTCQVFIVIMNTHSVF